MNSGLITVHNDDPENFIDDLEYFSSIVYDSYVDTRETSSKKIPPKLEIHKWMEDKTLTCTTISLCPLRSDL